MKTILLAYVRTSDASKDGDGRAETHLMTIEGYLGASVKPYHVFYDRNVSGKVPPSERTGMSSLISFIEDNADEDTQFRIVASDFSRFSRKAGALPDLAEELEKYGATLESAMDGRAYVDPDKMTSNEWLSSMVLDLMPEYFRRQTAEKTRAGQKRKKAEGGYCGGMVPYGFALIEDELVESPVEQVRLEHAKRMLNEGQSIRNTASATGVPKRVVERIRKEYADQMEEEQGQ